MLGIKGQEDQEMTRGISAGQPRSQNGDFGVMDVKKMIEAFTTCLGS